MGIGIGIGVSLFCADGSPFNSFLVVGKGVG